MYTQRFCAAPNGGTQIPPGITEAVQSAAQRAVLGNSNVLDAVNSAITNFLRGRTIDPNAIRILQNVGAQAAKQQFLNLQVGRANLGWWRLMQRQPADFAGAPVQAGDILQPNAAVVANVINPISRAQFDAAAVDRHRASLDCNPDFSDAPEIVPIDGGFEYRIPGQNLSANPPSVDPITASAQPLPFQGLGAYRPMRRLA